MRPMPAPWAAFVSARKPPTTTPPQQHITDERTAIVTEDASLAAAQQLPAQQDSDSLQVHAADDGTDTARAPVQRGQVHVQQGDESSSSSSSSSSRAQSPTNPSIQRDDDVAREPSTRTSSPKTLTTNDAPEQTKAMVVATTASTTAATATDETDPSRHTTNDAPEQTTKAVAVVTTTATTSTDTATANAETDPSRDTTIATATATDNIATDTDTSSIGPAVRFETCGNYIAFRFYVPVTSPGQDPVKIGCNIEKYRSLNADNSMIMMNGYKGQQPPGDYCRVKSVCEGSLAEQLGLAQGDVLSLSRPGAGPGSWLEYSRVLKGLNQRPLSAYALRLRSRKTTGTTTTSCPTSTSSTSVLLPSSVVEGLEEPTLNNEKEGSDKEQGVAEESNENKRKQAPAVGGVATSTSTGDVGTVSTAVEASDGDGDGDGATPNTAKKPRLVSPSSPTQAHPRVERVVADISEQCTNTNVARGESVPRPIKPRRRKITAAKQVLVLSSMEASARESDPGQVCDSTSGNVDSPTRTDGRSQEDHLVHLHTCGVYGILSMTTNNNGPLGLTLDEVIPPSPIDAGEAFISPVENFCQVRDIEKGSWADRCDIRIGDVLFLPLPLTVDFGRVSERLKNPLRPLEFNVLRGVATVESSSSKETANVATANVQVQVLAEKDAVAMAGVDKQTQLFSANETTDGDGGGDGDAATVEQSRPVSSPKESSSPEKDKGPKRDANAASRERILHPSKSRKHMVTAAKSAPSRIEPSWVRKTSKSGNGDSSSAYPPACTEAGRSEENHLAHFRTRGDYNVFRLTTNDKGPLGLHLHEVIPHHPMNTGKAFGITGPIESFCRVQDIKRGSWADRCDFRKGDVLSLPLPYKGSCFDFRRVADRLGNPLRPLELYALRGVATVESSSKETATANVDLFSVGNNDGTKRKEVPVSGEASSSDGATKTAKRSRPFSGTKEPTENTYPEKNEAPTTPLQVTNAATREEEAPLPIIMPGQTVAVAEHFAALLANQKTNERDSSGRSFSTGQSIQNHRNGPLELNRPTPPTSAQSATSGTSGVSSEESDRGQAHGLVPFQGNRLEAFQTRGKYEVLRLPATGNGYIGCSLKKIFGYSDIGDDLLQSLQIPDSVKSYCKVKDVDSSSLAETWGLRAGDVIFLSPPSVGPWLDYEGVLKRLRVRARPVGFALYVIRVTEKTSSGPVGDESATGKEAVPEQGAVDAHGTVGHREKRKVIVLTSQASEGGKATMATGISRVLLTLSPSPSVSSSATMSAVKTPVLRLAPRITEPSPLMAPAGSTVQAPMKTAPPVSASLAPLAPRIAAAKTLVPLAPRIAELRAPAPLVAPTGSTVQASLSPAPAVSTSVPPASESADDHSGLEKHGDPTAAKQNPHVGTLIAEGHLNTGKTQKDVIAALTEKKQETGSGSPDRTNWQDSSSNLSTSESSTDQIVSHLRLLAKLFCESKANRDAASRTDTCLAVIKLLLSNVEKIQIAANVTLACLTHEHEVNAAAVQSLQGIPYILGSMCRPNASARLQSAALSALNSLSQVKLCRSEIIEYRGGDGIRGIVDAMRHSKDNRDLQNQGCRLLGQLSDCPEGKRFIIEHDGLAVVAETILKYPDDDEIRESALYTMTCFSKCCSS